MIFYFEKKKLCLKLVPLLIPQLPRKFIFKFFSHLHTGSNDPDELIVQAFRAYENDEKKIDAEMFRHALMTWGDKFSQDEVDDIFGEFEVDDDGMLASKDVIGLFVAGGGEEKKEEEKQEEAPKEEAPPPEADAPAEGGGKKKKKKKKAAK